MQQHSDIQIKNSSGQNKGRDQEVLIKAERVSKKFSTRLRSSMKYGMTDILRDFIGFPSDATELRPNEFWSVRDVSFEIRRGECVGLIGPNGAGKSTILKMLNGIIMPDMGSIEINGRVGALIEIGAGFHPLLSGRENIYINASIMGLSKKEIDEKFDSIVKFAELNNFIDTPVSYYSSGMYVRLGFAIAAHLEPDILLIDEVLAVGDVGFRAKCYDFIAETNKRAAIVLVSHSMPAVARVCSRVSVMSEGKMFYGNTTVEGIGRYYSLFPESEIKKIEYGSATIKNISINSDAGRETRQVEYGSGMEIIIEAKVNPEIKNIVANIAFLNQEQQFAAQCNSAYNEVIIANTHNGNLTLNVKINEVLLNPGKYFLSFLFFDPEFRKNLLWYHAAETIEVKGNFIGGAPLQFRAAWKANNKPLETT